MPSAHQAPVGGSPVDLRAMLLLSGSLRSTGLLAAIHRSILDLPVSSGRNLRDLWLDSASALARGWQLDHLRVRVLLAPGAYEPRSLASSGPVRFSVERDRGQFLGTGGVVRDACERYPDDTYVLVANAGQLMIEPLEQIASDLAATGADVVVTSHEDGTPSGLTLLRCACLRILPDVGYIDLKEQALQIIGKAYRVKVLRRTGPAALPIRTLADYIRALQSHHRRTAGAAACDDPFAEDWYPSFQIVEDGATVHPAARIHDSVILLGGVVEKGATVIRSVVCPGGVVWRDTSVIDRLVTPSRPSGA